MTVFEHRRIGLEQQFFLVDQRGILSNRADEFLDECREAAHAAKESSSGYPVDAVHKETPPKRGSLV